MDCLRGCDAFAELVVLHRELASSHIDAAWWDNLDETLANPGTEPDSEWRWREIISRLQNKPGYRFIGIRTEDDYFQGAMILRLGFKSLLEPGKLAVFVERIASAPQNRGKLVKSPRYQGCGTGLLAFAAAQSYFFGQDGRVALVPVANLDWYQRRGFEKTDTEISDGQIYELPKLRALELLRAKGLIQ